MTREALERRESLAEAWERFWFEPRSTAPLAFLRIAIGALTMLWGISVLADAATLYGASGIFDPPEPVRLRWSVLYLVPSDAAATGMAVLLVAAGLALAVGLRPRVAAAVGFVALVSFQHRNPWVGNSGDTLLRLCLLYLALAPSGAALSLDRWLHRREDFWEVPRRAPWALRLIQIQLSVTYLFAVFWKVQGSAWVDGHALAWAWRAGDVARLPLPMFVYDSLLWSAVLSYVTIIGELALAILLWNRRARPYVVAFGLLLHLGIEVTMTVGFFGLTICAMYLAFVEPRTAERWMGRLRSLRQRPAMGRGKPAVDTGNKEPVGPPA